jgi:hypothetical protein
MSGLLPIVCDNCGAKYKLPESFTASQSKCQKCGSVINVDAQRQPASTASAAAKPATGARPAVARSAEPPRPTERSNERASRSARSEAGRERGSRGRRDAPPKKSSLPLVLGGIGLLVVAAIVVWALKR